MMWYTNDGANSLGLKGINGTQIERLLLYGPSIELCLEVVKRENNGSTRL
jgi:hypothetical protein